MKDPDEFDTFYKDARERLLVQTYALTGDLAASRRAVRDAFVVGWHRWRKLQRLDDPESIVRPHAWRLAQRRHTARVWHREKDIDPEVKATLEALGKLTVPQRRALVLTQYAAVTMAQMAREIGLPLERAARELQLGASQLALHRGVPTSALSTLFAPLADSVVDQVRWPRAPIVRRAGARRRRAHTAVGVVGVLAAVAASGSLVTDAAGARPTLDREGTPSAHARAIAAADVTLPDSTLVSADQLDATLTSRHWTLGHTNDNSAGSGVVLPCQVARYADPDGAAALVRTFDADAPKKLPDASAVQFSEASGTTAAAQKTFDTTLDWFAGCTAARVQLMATRTPEAVGDEAVQFVLRSWNDPVTTYVVGVARTGLYTTTTVTQEKGSERPDTDADAALLADAVTGLCSLKDSGPCAPAKPTLTSQTPLPTGPEPALVSEVDLPPVSGVAMPWVGTEPAPASTNLAATACDHTSFTGSFHHAPLDHDVTRTFLIPGTRLPDKFGLTETAAALPTQRAEAFADQVRSRLGSCMDRSLGSTVVRIFDRHDDDTSIAVWRVSVQVTDKQRIDYWMAILRNGTAVAQLGFIPATGVKMSDGAFPDLAERALARLARLPGPSS